MLPLCSNPFCKRFWSEFGVPKRPSNTVFGALGLTVPVHNISFIEAVSKKDSYSSMEVDGGTTRCCAICSL